MTAEITVGAALLPFAVWLMLTPLSDLLAALRALLYRASADPPTGQVEPLLFLIPAHNEELLIGQCIDSLASMDYPSDRRTLLVIADNCTDRTAAIARARGASVLERSSLSDRGKGHAIAWALSAVPLAGFSAVVIVDADTIVEPDFCRALMNWAPLSDRALQTYDGLSNEFESSLTRMAGLLTRNRYGTSLPIKARAGLSCPMTGDGIVLGTNVLTTFPWNVNTITEGWELYARLTTRGQQILYAGDAKLYAQEASTLSASRTQRRRWASGRLAVLRTYWSDILKASQIGPLQKLDLLAELSNLGPVTHCTLGLFGALITLLVRPELWPLLLLMFISPILHQLTLSSLSLRRHPDPWGTVSAFAKLPHYAVWRLGLAVGALRREEGNSWIRTTRH
jgi:cellulose synthase/poly-beta-1,6-N-acetylglucosamine synthase-like glycosyltransferase